jgi:membrane protease YdiL (CAAX protease family)
MTIPTGPRTNSLYHASELAAGSVFSAGRAIAVLFASFGGFVTAAVVLGAANVDLLVTVIVGEALLVLIPFAIARGRRALLGFRRPELRFFVAALLIGSSQWFLNLIAVEAIDSWIGLSKEGVARLQAVAVDPPLLLSLLAIAVMPALGEEVLFRGVVARGLATRFVPAVAIVLSAALFSAFHLSVIQAVPTFLLGLVYGYLALSARSCVPTMIAHLINNSLAILVAQGAVPWLADALSSNTVVSAGLALALTTSGIVLAARGDRT